MTKIGLQKNRIFGQNAPVRADFWVDTHFGGRHIPHIGEQRAENEKGKFCRAEQDEGAKCPPGPSRSSPHRPALLHSSQQGSTGFPIQIYLAVKAPTALYANLLGSKVSFS